MKPQFWTNIKAFAAGTMCATVMLWLGLAVLVLTRLGIDALVPGVTSNSGHFAKPWVDVSWMVFLTVGTLVLCFYAGVTSAFFWRNAVNVNDSRQKQRWSILSVPLLFAPLIPWGFWWPPSGLGSGISASFAMWFFLTAICGLPFVTGIYYGLKWQPLRRWRWFLGLSNSWERDDEGKA